MINQLKHNICKLALRLSKITKKDHEYTLKDESSEKLIIIIKKIKY